MYISNKPETEKEIVPLPVVVATPIIKDVPVFLSTYAYVQARSIIPIVPLVSGEIKEHRVKVGDYVNKGDVITRIDDEIHTLNEQNAAAAFHVASASFDRTKTLFESGSVSKQIYDEVKGKYEVTKGQYELAKTQLAYTTILSPTSGTVIASEVSVGSMGQAGQMVAVVSDLEDMVLDITLPSTYWSTIQAHRDDLSVTIEIDDNSKGPKVIETKVETISPVINPQDASFTITCALDGAKNKDITVGMYVNVHIVYTSYQDALVIPHSALTNSSHIFTYDSHSKEVTRTLLKDFTILDNDIIIDNSFKNRLIVVKGAHLLADSQIVAATIEGE